MNHVGRPSNKELKRKKIRKILLFSSILGIVLLVVVGVLLFSNIFKTSIGNSSNKNIATKQYYCDETGFKLTGSKCKKTITQQPFTLGDINLDSKVSDEDLILLSNYLDNEDDKLTKFQHSLADVDQNGELSYVDASLLNDYVNKNNSVGTSAVYYENIGVLKICEEGFTLKSGKCTKTITKDAKIKGKIEIAPVGFNDNILYINNKSNNFKMTSKSNDIDAKNIKWSSSNDSIAVVDKTGLVTPKNIGKVNIIATTGDGKNVGTYNLVVKKKVIVVITASAGVRMNNWFKTYTSANQNYYDINLGTLNYIYKSGSGFDFQYGDGLEKAKNKINGLYKESKEYIDLSVFFTLTGNSVKSLDCGGIQKSDEYVDIATKYNNAIKQFIKMGYTHTKGYVISHSPLNTKFALTKFPTQAAKSKIVYSTNETIACKKGNRSAYKYWLSNQKMKSTLATGKYSNLTFVDNYSNFVVLKDRSKRTFTWLKNEKGITYDNIYKTTDGLHWDKNTTKIYMQKAFDEASM